jgi:predicted phage tail protein
MVDEEKDVETLKDIDIIVTIRSSKSDLKSLQKALKGIRTFMNSQSETSRIELIESDTAIKSLYSSTLRTLSDKYHQD